MNIKRGITLIICTVFFLLSVDNVLSQEAKEKLTGHVSYGKMIIPNTNPDLKGGDYEGSLFGADVQKPFGGGTFKYGIETGAFFSMDNDLRRFGAGLYARAGIDIFLTEKFGL